MPEFWKKWGKRSTFLLLRLPNFSLLIILKCQPPIIPLTSLIISCYPAIKQTTLIIYTTLHGITIGLITSVSCRKHIVTITTLRTACFIRGTLIYKGRLGVMLVKVAVLRSIVFPSIGGTEGRLRFTDDCVRPCGSSVTNKHTTKITKLPLLWLPSLQIQLYMNSHTIWYPFHIQCTYTSTHKRKWMVAFWRSNAAGYISQ